MGGADLEDEEGGDDAAAKRRVNFRVQDSVKSFVVEALATDVSPTEEVEKEKPATPEVVQETVLATDPMPIEIAQADDRGEGTVVEATMVPNASCWFCTSI